VNTLLEELAHQVPKHEGTLMTIAEQLILQGEQKGLLQGRQEGEQKGRQEGRQEALKEMARNLLLSGIDKDAIMKATGFSSRELELISH
jgi:predicted transposase/invertase (TIGR01784 family)